MCWWNCLTHTFEQASICVHEVYTVYSFAHMWATDAHTYKSGCAGDSSSLFGVNCWLPVERNSILTNTFRLRRHKDLNKTRWLCYCLWKIRRADGFSVFTTDPVWSLSVFTYTVVKLYPLLYLCVCVVFGLPKVCGEQNQQFIHYSSATTAGVIFSDGSKSLCVVNCVVSLKTVVPFFAFNPFIRSEPFLKQCVEEGM